MEGFKSYCNTFEEAAKIALQIESPSRSAHYFSSFSDSSYQSERPVLMEIGNLGHIAEMSEGARTLLQNDLRNNACIVCRRKGGRPRKRSTEIVNNVQACPVDEKVFDKKGSILRASEKNNCT